MRDDMLTRLNFANWETTAQSKSIWKGRQQVRLDRIYSRITLRYSLSFTWTQIIYYSYTKTRSSKSVYWRWPIFFRCKLDSLPRISSPGMPYSRFAPWHWNKDVDLLYLQLLSCVLTCDVNTSAFLIEWSLLRRSKINMKKTHVILMYFDFHFTWV